MTREAFIALVSPLVVAMRADFDQVTWGAYYRALKDVPASLLEAAVDRSTKSDRFMPKPGELRQYSEDVRKALIASVPYLPCVQCDESGWQTFTVDGVSRVQRCACWKRHQEKIAALGVGTEPLALPAPKDWHEPSEVA